MRWVGLGVGIIMFLSGAVFFLQGINILPGSYMTGDPKWAVIGMALMGFGGYFCYVSLRRRQVNSKL
jgi:hypothetical protein